MGIRFSKDSVVIIPEEYHGSHYAVKRTSGVWESGWSISKDSHQHRDGAFCAPLAESGSVWARAHAGKAEGSGGWRIHMFNGIANGAPGHACGWRYLETMHPEGLADLEAVAWREKFARALDDLYAQQAQVHSLYARTQEQPRE